MSENSTEKKTKHKFPDFEANNDPCTLNKRIKERQEKGKRPSKDEEFALKVLNKSLNCIYIYDVRSGRNVFVNDRFAELTGYNLKDLNAMNIAQFFTLFYPDDRQVLTDHIDNVIRTGEDSPEIECRIMSNDKKWVWCLLRNSVFSCNDDGSVSLIMVSLLNIAGHKTAKKWLELENREVMLLNRIMRVFIEESGDKLFDLALDIVQDGLASRHGVFGYISSPGHLTCPSLSKMLDECEVADKCIHYPPEKWKGLWARALIEKRSFYNNEPSDVPPGHPAIRNNLAAPILFQGEVIGLLNLANKESAYTENDRMLLEAMAGRIAPLLYAWIQKKLHEDELEVKIKERTAELQKAKELQNDVFEALPAYVVLLTPDYHVPFANRFFRERFGESQGKCCYEYLFGRNEPCEVCETYKVLKTMSPHRWEWIGPDGRNYDVYDFPFTDADGSLFIMEMGIDITEKKRAADALKDLNEKLEQRGKELQKSHDDLEEKVKQRTSELAASIERLQEIRKDLSHAQKVAQIGSWRLDLRRNILTWSDETYRIFGVPAGTPLTYETFLGIIHPEDRLLVDNQWSDCLRGESYDIEHRIIVNGEVKWVLEKAYLEIDDAGETIGAFGIAQDITKRKASEESIKASLSEKEVLLKEIHHRVKNNMQIISSLVALQADESEDEIIRSALQDVTHRVRSMAMVHEKLYQSTDLAQVDFAEYAKGLLDYLCRFYGIASSNISIKTDLEQMLIPVNEAVPCGLILNELISNALRHAFPDYQRGEVVVSLHKNRQGGAVLSVRDNGKGLPAGFDWQKARSLGLRLVQMLAGQLHADLKVHSDKGSEFKLIFRRLNK